MADLVVEGAQLSEALRREVYEYTRQFCCEVADEISQHLVPEGRRWRKRRKVATSVADVLYPHVFCLESRLEGGKGFAISIGFDEQLLLAQIRECGCEDELIRWFETSCRQVLVPVFGAKGGGQEVVLVEGVVCLATESIVVGTGAVTATAMAC